MLIGHHRQLQYLKNLAKSGHIPHALLFWGQEQLGKKTIALEFAKLLDCRSPADPVRGCRVREEAQSKQTSNGVDGLGCQMCQPCREIERGIYPDLKVVAPLAREIQIAQIREVSHLLCLKPFYKLKTVLIDNAHLMTKEAQGCLLKTLEEPRGKALLILITDEPETLLATVLSRVERLAFFEIQDSLIERGLASKGATREQAKVVSAISFGRPGRAIELFLNNEKLKTEQEGLKEFLKVLGAPLGDRFQYIKGVCQDKQPQLKETLGLWLFYFRNIFQNQCSGQGFNDFSIWQTKKSLQLIEKALFLLTSTNVNPRLLLENLMLDLPIDKSFANYEN